MPTILERIRQNAHKEYLRRRAHDTEREICHCCGTLLESENGPLIWYFVMDIQGNFYCPECDTRFEDGDERIYCEEDE